MSKSNSDQNKKLVGFQEMNGFEADVREVDNNKPAHIGIESKDKAEFYWPKDEDQVMKKILKYSAIFWACVTVVFLVLDQIYHNEFMANSIQLTISLQSNESAFTTGYNSTIVKICDMLWSYWPFIAQYFYNDKRVFMKTFSAMLFTLWLKNCMKLIYLDNRPNILSNQIAGQQCKCEFGRPSGTLINSTTIIMFIAWDCFSRNSKRKQWLRILALLIAKVLIVVVVFSILWVGFHSWNQMLDSILISFTLVYVLSYYEKQICYFFHTIIDHRLNHRDSKKNIIICGVVFIVFLAIYLIILSCQWNAKDFSIALQGACPQCAYKNWCSETILQDTTAFGFPLMVFFLAVRCHKFVYNPNHLSDTWTFNVREEGWWKKDIKGILRIVISYIFWAPIIYWFIPHFTTFGANVGATPVKNAIGCFLYFNVRPFLFKWLKLGVKGDIEELSEEDRSEWKYKGIEK